ncbi:MAG: helix-turn-helix transcriptional regulator [Acidimicrobiia bacterium]|nr:helix-turn-helix transcriptional regulator [Acidimicrobiia bacterium]
MDDVERVLFPSSTVQVGTFRCPPRHERFPGGRVETHLVAFPWSAVMIEQEGAAPVVADPSIAMLYNPRQEYRRHPVDGRGDHCAWYSINADWLANISNGEPYRFASSHTRVSSGLFLRHQLLVHYLMANAHPDPFVVEETSLRLLADLFAADPAEAHSPTATTPRTVENHVLLVRDTKEFLARNFRDRLDLAMIASAVGSSPFHLTRLFGALEGTTIHRHISALRLRAAVGLLLESDWDIATIAHQVGFSSHSHLTRRFTTHFGFAPRQVRQLSSKDLSKMVKV